MLWIFVENGVDNTGMFLLLLTSAHTETGLFYSHTTPPLGRMVVHMKVERETARTADLNWPKEFSRTHDVMFSI